MVAAPGKHEERWDELTSFWLHLIVIHIYQYDWMAVGAMKVSRTRASLRDLEMEGLVQVTSRQTRIAPAEQAKSSTTAVSQSGGLTK